MPEKKAVAVPSKALSEPMALTAYILKMLTLLGALTVISAAYTRGQPRTAVGIGAGLETVPIDRELEVYEIINPIPANWIRGYYSTEIPAVLLPLKDGRYRLKLGANSVALLYRDDTERRISETLTEQTVFEIISLNLYAGLQSPGKPLWWCAGYWFGGLLFSENLLIEAIETHRRSASGEEEVARSDQVGFRIDYNLGLMLGAGISRSLGRFGEVALQTTVFAVNSALELPDGYQPNPSTLQLQLLYWITFD
jgi:hypothetical protein